MYRDQIVTRKNDRDEDTLNHIATFARSMLGEHMRYRERIAPNGFSNHAGRLKQQRKSRVKAI